MATFAFVGNATDDASGSGIFSYAVDDESGALRLRAFKPQTRPHCISLSATAARLYAVSYAPSCGGHAGGAVYSYAIEPATAQLTEINHRVLPFTFPSYIQQDRTGRFLFVACTSGGGVVVLPIDLTGALGKPSSIHAHRGSAMVPLGATRNPTVVAPGACQPHAIGADPTNRLVVVPDVGLNRTVLYRFDEVEGRLERTDADIVCPPGTGPRHFVFHPHNGFLYVLNQTESSVSVLDYNAAAGLARVLHTVRTVPPGFAGRSLSAEIVLSPDGRLMYCTNRGHDSVAVLSIEESWPYAHLLGCQPTNGTWPCGLGVSLRGGHLFVANRGSGSVVTLRTGGASGLLEPTGESVLVSSPNAVALRLSD